MKKRLLLIGLLICLSVYRTAMAETTTESKPNTTAIENELYRVEVAEKSGVITRIYDKTGKIELLGEPRLADNFRLNMGIPGTTETVIILGKSQRASVVKTTSDSLSMRWAGPLTSTKDATYDVDFILRITLAEEGIHFQSEAVNRTETPLAQIDAPILGGVTGIGDRQKLEGAWGGWNPGEPIPPEQGTTPRNILNLNYPFPLGMPWFTLSNTALKHTLYFGSHDPLGRYQNLMVDSGPGLKADNNGKPDYALPVGYLYWRGSPYLKRDETFLSPDIVIRIYEGDWHSGARTFRKWFTSKFTIPDTRSDWLRREMAYQDTMFLLPEGNVLWRYKDIPRWVGDAAKFGVKTVLISGWHTGGHDAGYPDYQPDPRLGTWEELAAAISECHKIGVKVLFFVNTLPIHTDTEWFKKELHEYQGLTAEGHPYGPYAFGMGTLSARMGRYTHQYVWASTGLPQFREIIVRQMKKLAEIGADGLHIDKFISFGLDFNPLLKLPPDRASTEGQYQILEEIQHACREVNPEFVLSLESHRWDRTIPYALVTWAWPTTWNYDVPMLNKYTFPEWVDSLAVVQPYDYNVVNNAVRYGYFLLIGFGHYTSWMGNEVYRPLAEYIKEIQRLREELKDTIYLGKFLDTLETDFSGPKDTRCSIHRNRDNGNRAAVIVNFAAEPREVTLKNFASNPNGHILIYEPFKKPWRARLPLTMKIPAERLAIAVEQ